MNIFLITTIVLVVLFVLYIILTRRTMKKLIDLSIVWQQAGRKAKNDLYILTEQYRQLANINKALREVNQVKKGAKK